jgi:Cof subfamily protein (haloacid dehalogenase superfamily)
MNIRLVVSDVDGTLLTNDKRVTPASLETIHRLRKQGIHFTIISSRPPKGLKVVGDLVSLTGPVPTFNGGVIVSPNLVTVLREKLLEPIVAECLLRELVQPNISFWVYTDVDWYVPDLNGPYVQHEIHVVQFEPIVARDLTSTPLDRVAKIVAVSEDFVALAELEKWVQQEFRGAVSATRSQDYYLDITHPDANKGEGILLISELMNIPTSQIASIGDMQNDVSMFRQSGLSIAMGNATPDVQRAAMFTTTSNEEDGFAKAVETYVLTPTDKTIMA